MAIEAKANAAQLAALASKLDAAIGKWETANAAVSNAVRPSIYGFSGHIYPQSRTRPPTAAEMGLGSLASNEDWEKLRDVFAPPRQKLDGK